MSLIMSDDDIKALAVTAQEQFQQKNFEPALQAFRALTQLRPRNAHWADRYAHCEMSLKRWLEAQTAWAEVIARHGLSVGRVNGLARCFIETRSYQSARDVLMSAHTEIEPNANFFVFSSVSALALGDRASALRAASSIEESAGETSEDAVKYFCAVLQRLVNEGHGAEVVWLVDALFAGIKAREKLLRLGLFATEALALFERKFFYASELLRLYPNRIQENIAYLGSLIDTQRLEDALDHANYLNNTFPKIDRAPQYDKALEILQHTLHARPKWRAVLRDNVEPETFSAVNLKLAALLTVKAYPEAVSVAEQALANHGEHPWFMSILAKVYDKLGELDAAANWLGRAVLREPERVSFLFQLADVQIRAGKLADADNSVAELAGSHPRLPATLSLLSRLGKLPPDSVEARSKPPRIADRQRETWLHAGDSGDIIYALAAVKGGGGGRLFLTSIAGTREPMAEEKIVFLEPLLSAQSYVDEVAAWQGEPITRDFLVLRHHLVPSKDLATQQWQSVLEEVAPDIQTPWLTLPPRQKHGRPVFARSPRYRNPAWDAFWRELKNASPDAIFVGSEEEFLEFGHGEHYLASDALDLAHIIHGASIFVGNQSLPYAIAEGLKVGRMLEVYRPSPNCIFPGALALAFERPESQE